MVQKDVMYLKCTALCLRTVTTTQPPGITAALDHPSRALSAEAGIAVCLSVLHKVRHTVGARLAPDPPEEDSELRTLGFVILGELLGKLEGMWSSREGRGRPSRVQRELTDPGSLSGLSPRQARVKGRMHFQDCPLYGSS